MAVGNPHAGIGTRCHTACPGGVREQRSSLLRSAHAQAHRPTFVDIETAARDARGNKLNTLRLRGGGVRWRKRSSQRSARLCNRGRWFSEKPGHEDRYVVMWTPGWRCHLSRAPSSTPHTRRHSEPHSVLSKRKYDDDQQAFMMIVISCNMHQL